MIIIKLSFLKKLSLNLILLNACMLQTRFSFLKCNYILFVCARDFVKVFLTGKYSQLDVGKNVGITDEGARAIAGALERNQSLRILYVGECAITVDGEQVRDFASVFIVFVYAYPCACVFVCVCGCTRANTQ